ncbi:hypothetical protein ABZP36_025795 [Zizania latifolia]
MAAGKRGQGQRAERRRRDHFSGRRGAAAELGRRWVRTEEREAAAVAAAWTGDLTIRARSNGHNIFPPTFFSRNPLVPTFYRSPFAFDGCPSDRAAVPISPASTAGSTPPANLLFSPPSRNFPAPTAPAATASSLHGSTAERPARGDGLGSGSGSDSSSPALAPRPKSCHRCCVHFDCGGDSLRRLAHCGGILHFPNPYPPFQSSSISLFEAFMSDEKLGKEQPIGRDPFTLLQVPPENHRSSTAKLHPKEVISYKAHRSSIPLHESCKSTLQKLGLYQVALLGNINTDRNLVAGLVERWRPETHSFHFPFGEMTVTLQDVSCLLGLPIGGEPVTGVTDSSDIWREKLGRLLNTSIPDEAFRMKSLNGKKTCSSYHLRREWLHKKFSKVPSGASWEYIDAYTRAFCLDLIGSILLPDNSGDSVPAIYIQFLENLEDPPQYNWGAAVLAHLYRSLCRASCASCKCMYGPLTLLQMWHWTRFSIARPARKDNTYGPPLGGDDLEARPPFGIKWSGHHSFKDVPHNGIEFYREQYEKLKDSNVVWQPYDEKISLLHPRVQRESALWLARVTLIHFWIVEDHYPDRVMRQFGLFQVIPPPPPRDWASSVMLHKIVRTGGDWSVKHAQYISEWKDLPSITVTEKRPYDPSTRDKYRQWFKKAGMPSLLTISAKEAELPMAQELDPEKSHLFQRAVILNLAEASYGIKCLQNQGAKKIGKVILKYCRARLEDAGHVDALNNLLRKHNLPTDIDSIQDISENDKMDIPDLDSLDNTNLAQFHELLVPYQKSHDDHAEDTCITQVHPLRSHASPISWPENGTMTREWVANLTAVLDWSSRHLRPEQLPTLLPSAVIENLVLAASVHLHHEPNCIHINPRSDQTVIVIGDVHGQLHDVMFLLQDAGFPSDERIFVFNGDYVNRGAWGFETFILLLSWKVFLVNSVVLLRGSHESKDCTTDYGFKTEVFAKYGVEGPKIYQKFLKCFADLPLASVISGCVFTTHGGLFRGSTAPKQSKKGRGGGKSQGGGIRLGTLQELGKVRRFVLNPQRNSENLIIGDVLWSNPWMKMGLFQKEERRLGLLWGPDVTEEFLERNNLKLIIRSHEGPDARHSRDGFPGMDGGYSIDHKVKSGRLITLFSAPDYPQFQATENRYNNHGAYVVLHPPTFSDPEFHRFDAVKPRPTAVPYYDLDSDEDSDLQAMDIGSSHQ